MESVAPIGGRRDRTARLQWVGDEAVVDEIEVDGVGGLGEGAIGRRAVARFPPEREVGRDIVPHQRRPRLQRRRGRRYLRQRRVVDLDALGAVASEIGGLGHDHRHPVADMANPADRQRPARRIGARRAVRVLDLPDARQRPISGGAVFGPGQDRQHARERRRRIGRQTLDAGMGVGRAQEVGMGQTRQPEIVDVAPEAAEKASVLAACGRLADAELRHSRLPTGLSPTRPTATSAPPFRPGACVAKNSTAPFARLHSREP